MKTWITYIASIALGLSASLLLTDISGYANIITELSMFMVNIGMFVVFPLVFFSASSAVASLQRDNKLASTVFYFLLWTILTSILLPLLTSLLYFIVPSYFPASSSSSTDLSIVENISVMNFVDTLRTSFMPNSFVSFVSSSNTFIPILIFAWILGYCLKPTTDIIRPSYVVFNSLTEVFYKVALRFTQFMPFVLIFISSAFFTNLIKSGEFAASFVSYFSIFIIFFIVLSFAIIPLIFAIVTKFKVNPYKVYFRAIASCITGFFSSNVLLATFSLMSLDRKNNGIQKRILGVSTPLATILTRGGSASISCFVTLGVIASATSNPPTILTSLFVALACFLVSFTSSFALGYEVFFISIVSIKILNIMLPGTQLSLIAFIPVLNAFGSALDIQLWNYGNYIIGATQNTNCLISRKDVV